MSDPHPHAPSRESGGDDIDNAAQDWFLRLSADGVTDAEWARFRAWCEADPRHRAAIADLRELWDDAGALRSAFASNGGAKRIPRVRNLAGRFGLPAFRLRGGSVATAALGLACSVLLLLAAPFVASYLAADYSVGVGKVERVVLADGSVAWLNTDTAIAVDFTESGRNVALLRGEAQFDVAKDPERPFAVAARKGRSTALGTVFAVRDHGDGKKVTVAVGEGVVEVVSPAASGPMSEDSPSRAVLTAGREVSYREGAPPEAARDTNFATASAWRKGFIAIDGLPLAEALAEIDRYWPGKIVLLAKTVNAEPVTARLSIPRIEDGLQALAATHGLTITRITNYILLVR